VKPNQSKLAKNPHQNLHLTKSSVNTKINPFDNPNLTGKAAEIELGFGQSLRVGKEGLLTGENSQQTEFDKVCSTVQTIIHPTSITKPKIRQSSNSTEDNNYLGLGLTSAQFDSLSTENKLLLFHVGSSD
jgi:hypothetical protein